MSSSLPKGVKEKSAVEMREAHEAWRDSQEIITKCGVEGCTDEFSGTAADGRDWALRHRRVAHPDLANAQRRRFTPEQQRERAMLQSEWRRRKVKGEE